MKTLRFCIRFPLILAASALIFSALPAVSSQSVSIEYKLFDLDDSLGPGGDYWACEYVVTQSEPVFTETIGFTVYFPPSLYRSLEDPPQFVNGDWDLITLQPVPELPADGLYDALSLSATPSLVDAFVTRFVWLGGPSTYPGAQAFDVNQFDINGDFLGVLQSGMTIPEPATGVLLACALVAALSLRRRKCAGLLVLAIASIGAHNQLLAQGADDITLDGIEKVSERRVTRTVFEYTYRARAKNAATFPRRDVSATIIPTAAGITMTDDTVNFGNVSAGATVAGADTFTFKLDRTQPFDPASLVFTFTVAPPAPPMLANLTLPASVVRGANFTLAFDYEDPDADIEVVTFTQSDALVANKSGEMEARAMGISGEIGHKELTTSSKGLPFGPVQFTVQLHDATGLLSDTLAVAMNVVGEAATGVAPSVVSFTRDATSYDVPFLGFDRVPVPCALQVVDADGDLSVIRVRVTGPAGFEAVSEYPSSTFGFAGSGGEVTTAFFEFRNTHAIGDYTLQVTPFDRNGHGGAPASVTISLTGSGGEVSRLTIDSTSPEIGSPGEEITLDGTGFSNEVGAQTTFYLGEIPCEPVSITPTQARVLIPTGGRTGAIVARSPDGRRTITPGNIVVPEHIALTPAVDDAPMVSVGGSASFSAVVGSAREDRSLTWRVNGVAGGNAALGMISEAGIYTAPAAIPANPTVEITASLAAEATVVSPATPVTILPPPATPGSARVIAALGGTVAVPELDGRVVIPPGALAADATITARTLAQSELPDAGPGRRTLGAVEFGPSGTTFSSPVMVTIPLTVSRPAGTELRCRFYDSAGGTFVNEGIIATVNASGMGASAAIMHFSIPVLDEAALAPPPTTAPTLTAISPAEVEEGARVPIRLTGNGLSDDLRVEIRDEMGVLAAELATGTLSTFGDEAGFVLSCDAITGFDSGTRTYVVRLVRAHDSALFAEIPFQVRGLPELIVAAGASPPPFFNPAPMRVSKVDIGPGATVRVESGELRIDSLGDVRVLGTIDARGNSGNPGGNLIGGAALPTSGAGGKGRETDALIPGFNLAIPMRENFGQNGIDAVGEGYTLHGISFQGPTRELNNFTRAPRGLGGLPGDISSFDPVSLVSAVAECVFTLGIACPEAVARIADTISDAVAIADGGLDGGPGLGAPAFSEFGQAGGGGGGGGGRFEVSAIIAGVTVHGGSGGSGGSGGAKVDIRSARSIRGGAPGDGRPVVDASGGKGGDGSIRSSLVFTLFGAEVYEDEDSAAFRGGGGGGGVSGKVSASGAEGVFVDSETDRLRTDAGTAGLGGVVDYDMESGTIRSEYAYSPAANGQTYRARSIHRPFYPTGTFAAQVRSRAIMRIESGRASEIQVPYPTIVITGQGAGQQRTVIPTYNSATSRFEATVLLYPGFNAVRDPGIGINDPLVNTPRILVLGGDTDGDGLTPDDEADLGTDPNLADTDADGVNDGGEVPAGTNPLLPPAGRLDPTFIAPELALTSGGRVNCVAVQPDGKILIGGMFSFVRGQPRGGIARLNADGTLEDISTFNAGSGISNSSEIFSIAVQPSDGKILIGGDFTEVDGQPRVGIARLNANGTVESTAAFNPGTGTAGPFGSGPVRGVAMQPDGKIVIVGRFTSVDGQARSGIARLNTNGTVESTVTFNPGTGAGGAFGTNVSSVALQTDGKILIGGSFTNVDGQPRGGIARLNSNGSLEGTATFNPGTGVGVNQEVKTIAVQTDGKIVLGGDFYTVDGRGGIGIARLLANGNVEDTTTFNPGAGVGGPFGGGVVNFLAIQGDGSIVLGGKFTSVDGQPRNNIARINGNGSVESTATFDAGLGTAGPFGNAAVFGVAVQTDGKILLGGEFSTINGRLPGKIARLGANGVPETAPAFDPRSIVRSSSRGIVNATAVQPDGKILLAGQFSEVNGQPYGSIVRLLTDGSVDSTFVGAGAGADSPIFCIAVQTDGKIVIGGQFQNIGGQPRYKLARLNPDGTAESTATFNPNIFAPGQVNCLAIQPDGKILVGGQFNGIGGVPQRSIARLIGDGSLDPAFDPGTGVGGQFGSGYVYSIAPQLDGKVVIGGTFIDVNGEPRANIARLLANGDVEGNTFSIGAGANGQVGSVVVQPDGKILVGGSFSSFAGQPGGGITRLNANGTLDGTFAVGTGITGGFVSTIALQVDGHILIGGGFDAVDGQPRGHLARLLPSGSVESIGGFDPLGGADAPISSIALQSDGFILVGGQFATVAGQPRNSFARLKNDPTLQTLVIVNSSVATWLRSGATPEASYVAYDLSTDGGANWTPLGTGTRIPGGWQRTGLSLTGDGIVRARGRTSGGQRNGSAGLIEQTVAFSLPAPSALPAFAQWNLTQLGDSNADALGDPDNDGIPNLVEYALNLSPTSPNAVPFTATRFVGEDGERLRILIQRDPTHNDLTIEVEAADTLAGPWKSIATSEHGAPFTGPGYFAGDDWTPGIKTVEIRDTVNIGDTPTHFLRVKTTR